MKLVLPGAVSTCKLLPQLKTIHGPGRRRAGLARAKKARAASANHVLVRCVCTFEANHAESEPDE